MPMTEAGLETIIDKAWSMALGTTVGNKFARQATIRNLARKLAAHFNTVGWPASEEGVKPYVQQAINRYC